MSASNWTDDRVETLTQLWKDGASASQIARRLGGVTRNAVIGKIHRLGLPGRRPPSAPGARRSPPQGARSPRRRTPPPRPAQLAPCPVVEDIPEIGIATIVSVRYGQCRWPIGDPLEADFCLCGRTAVRGAYCARHGALAYRVTPRDHLLKLARIR